MRLFFALPVPPGSAEQLAHALRPLKPPPGWRWVPVANWHLTMLFIGSTTADRLSALIGLGESAVGQTRPTEGLLTALGTLPGSRTGRGGQMTGWSSRARLVVAGASDPEPFQPLHQQLAAGAAALGFPVERRPLLPHVTLARRGRSSRTSPGAPWPEPTLPPLAVPIPIERLVLYRSDATAEGQRYTELWAGELHGGGAPAPDERAR